MTSFVTMIMTVMFVVIVIFVAPSTARYGLATFFRTSRDMTLRFDILSVAKLVRSRILRRAKVKEHRSSGNEKDHLSAHHILSVVCTKKTSKRSPRVSVFPTVRQSFCDQRTIN